MFYYVWLILEPIRLALGYVGNLSERVASLAPFWVLTLFPQYFVHIYFAVGQDLVGWTTFEIEQIFSVGFLLLYTVELVVGWSTSKRLVYKAAADFHLQIPADDPGSNGIAT